VNAPFSRHGFALALALVTGSLAEVAMASTVLLVRPPNPSRVASEALMRMHGELASAGFDVSFATAVAGVDARASLEMLASGPGVDAVVAVLGDGAPDAIEVWVVDRVTGRSVVRHTPYQSGGERDAEVLAIRAIELLRASLLEVDMGGAGPALAPRPPPVATGLPAEAARAAGPSRWALEIGASVVTGFDGLGPAVLPQLRFDGVLTAWCVAQVTVAGLGTRSRVGSGEGTAQVAQQFGLGGVSLRWPSRMGVRAVVSLAAGALHTMAEGRAGWPYAGQTAAQWSFLADAGLGMHLALGARYELAAEAHAQLAEPYPRFRVLGTDVATAGRPTLLFTLGVLAWL
jgi:hypothetical protein